MARYGSNYLVGLNSFNYILLINGTDGSTIWTLGGEDNNFEDLSGGDATNIWSHHQPRFWMNANHVTLFDNEYERVNAVGCSVNCSKGLHLRVDYDDMTAEVVSEYYHPTSLNSLAQGSFAFLESGNALVAWGSQPGVTEHKGDEVVMDIQVGRLLNEWLEDANTVYRAFKMDWRGKPRWGPSIAVEDGTVYVSWNGATELAGWTVVSLECPSFA